MEIIKIKSKLSSHSESGILLPLWVSTVITTAPKIFLFMTLVLGGTIGESALANSDAALNPFGKDYITIELAENYPTANGNTYFVSAKRNLLFGYSHFLSRHWGVGISLGFKSLKRKDIDRELALLSLSNESYYIIRLYHPTYLMVGTKFLYMTPNQRSNLPLLKDPDYETEVGVGVSAKLSHVAGSWLYWLRVDRWRGTKTNRLHGFEAALGISYKIKK